MRERTGVHLRRMSKETGSSTSHSRFPRQPRCLGSVNPWQGKSSTPARHPAKWRLDARRHLLATVGDSQAAVAGLVAMRQNLVARREGARPEDRRWVMQMLDVRITATGKGFSVSLGVPSQVPETVAKGESEANFLSCRLYDTLLQSDKSVKYLFRSSVYDICRSIPVERR